MSRPRDAEPGSTEESADLGGEEGEMATRSGGVVADDAEGGAGRAGGAAALEAGERRQRESVKGGSAGAAAEQTAGAAPEQGSGAAAEQASGEAAEHASGSATAAGPDAASESASHTASEQASDTASEQASGADSESASGADGERRAAAEQASGAAAERTATDSVAGQPGADGSRHRAPRAGRRSPARAVIPREIELKYLVRDLEALRGWLARDWGGALDGVEVSQERNIEVEDRYIDTAYGALAAAGFGVRLRREDGGPFVVTVKSASHERPTEGDRVGGPAALSQRVEVEGPADGSLDPDAWPPSAAQELVNEVRQGARLRTLFTINQRRDQKILALEDGSVQVTLDWVAIFRGARPVTAFSILEVESKAGRNPDLARLAELIEATGFVTPEPRSKEEIAREYVARLVEDPAHRLPAVPKSPGVKADDPLAEAGRKVLRMHLARMLSFEAGTRQGSDIEDLHKMRVATRRMRAAWRVFDGAYRPKLQRRYLRELRTIARALGEVRDIDVLLEDLDRYMDRLPDAGREAMEPLRAAWRRDRGAARERLIARLDSKQYREFVEDYIDFTETPGAGEVMMPIGEPSLVRDTAGSRILSAYEHVRAYQALISWADVPTLHALRIEGKRLRYTLEYFAEVMPVTSRTLIATVTEMQDHLGLMNDAQVAAMTTRQWLNLNVPRLSAASRDAVGLYLDSREAEVERLRRSFGPLWRRITGRTFRRALGAAIAQIG